MRATDEREPLFYSRIQSVISTVKRLYETAKSGVVEIAALTTVRST